MEFMLLSLMARRLQVVIEESVEFLKKQLKQTRTALDFFFWYFSFW
jgi:hypothetical protein